MDTVKKGRRGILVLDGALLLCALGAKFLASAMIRWLPDCLFAGVGLTCPTCGATRCVREFFSGHFAIAFRLNPFIFCLIPYFAMALVLLNIGYLLPQQHCKQIGKAMIGEKAIGLLAIAFAIFGIGRMLLTLP
jgi:hypothetical protein